MRERAREREKRREKEREGELQACNGFRQRKRKGKEEAERVRREREQKKVRERERERERARERKKEKERERECERERERARAREKEGKKESERERAERARESERGRERRSCKHAATVSNKGKNEKLTPSSTALRWADSIAGLSMSIPVLLCILQTSLLKEIYERDLHTPNETCIHQMRPKCIRTDVDMNGSSNLPSARTLVCRCRFLSFT